MSKNLIVVESPAKAKTIEKYLGKDFTVLASYGHVRDLVPKEGAVDTEHGFTMKYEIIERNARHMEALAKAMAKADALYLATDPDREGEAISWHVYELLKERNLIKDKPVHRVAFYEITKAAVKAAVENPRDISMDLVNAQQARRALDYLVGFTLSPLLWKKIRRGLSAGRVQSPALRLIVEREEEIEKFKNQEYWTIEANNKTQGLAFTARLTEFKGEKLNQFSIANETQAHAMDAEIVALAKGKLKVAKVEKKQRKRNPTAPFTTSTLQQEAARKLGFTTKRTMQIAQQLYEGIDTGSGTAGLISYMRTDSVHLGQEAIADLRDLIVKRFGKHNLPETPREYKTKAKNAQEAHEAIRPTNSHTDPESIKEFLSNEQFRLYDLIWKRTVASQMIPATIDTVGVDLMCGDQHKFRATGSTITDPGFMSVYQEGFDDLSANESDDKILPPLKEGELVDLLNLKTEQHFTEPPPRYSEASLVKSLEEYGIGRPSTYSAIVSTLQQREYVLLDKKRFYPTDVGRVVNRFLTQYFSKYVDYAFTANLEDELDAVARGEGAWVPLLEHFWTPFKDLTVKIGEEVQRKDVTTEEIDEKCPKCGKPLSIRLGKRGRFIGCGGYPECDYTRDVSEEASQVAAAAQVVEGRVCPKCQGGLIIKQGPYGKFIGCSNYPDCRFIEPLEKPTDMGVECPECKKGSILKRKSRAGKIFFSCSRYPDCKYALWNEPLKEACPKCQWPILTLKVTKKNGAEKVCPQQACKFTEPMEPE